MGFRTLRTAVYWLDVAIYGGLDKGGGVGLVFSIHYKFIPLFTLVKIFAYSFK